MKKTLWIAGVVLVCVLALVLAACGGKDKGGNDTSAEANLLEFSGISFAGQTVEYDGEAHAIFATGVPEGATVSYTRNSGTDVGKYNASVTISKEGYKSLTLNADLNVTVPSAQSVVAARRRATEAADVGYNFHLNLGGTINVAGYSGTANANYDGKYRYNSASHSLQFMRTTSGILLYDATEYIALVGDTTVKVTANDKGVVKKINVLAAEDEELMLINRPIVALVDAIDANELTNISLAGGGDYMFKATLKLSADNALVNKALSIIAKQGTSISLKDVTFTNPVSGIVLYFNMNRDKRLNDFSLSAEVSFPVSAVSATIQLNYSQVGDSSAVTSPALGSVIIDKTQIGAELAAINAAVNAVKTSANYSLDFEVKNQFDPGWNVTATTDRYTARLYKHSYTLDDADFVAFNHSYEYKTHHEEDGRETYKYTLGNIQDGSVHRVSRKGGNTVTDVNDVTVDTQFDYLTDAVTLTAADVDCIRKAVSGTTTTYYVYLGNAYTASINGTIADMINSNDAEGVVPVNNYFDATAYDVKGSDMTVVLKNNALSQVEVETKIKYYPTNGDYTQKYITLTDSLTLSVNVKLDKAQDYTAPRSATNALTGLKAATYYVL